MPYYFLTLETFLDIFSHSSSWFPLFICMEIIHVMSYALPPICMEIIHVMSYALPSETTSQSHRSYVPYLCPHFVSRSAASFAADAQLCHLLSLFAAVTLDMPFSCPCSLPHCPKPAFPIVLYLPWIPLTPSGSAMLI